MTGANESLSDKRKSNKLGEVLQDTRYTGRVLGKRPTSTAVIVLSLAIGIGATTAVFSVTNTLFLKPLNYPSSQRLAILWLRSPAIDIFQDWPSPEQYLDIKAQN